jgi:uncharacterized membrane protein
MSSPDSKSTRHVRHAMVVAAVAAALALAACGDTPPEAMTSPHATASPRPVPTAP